MRPSLALPRRGGQSSRPALASFGAWEAKNRAREGESGRELFDEKKMHSVGFGRDIADLTSFMENIVLTQHQSRYPLITIGHSKGAHFLMRYLAYTDDPVTRAIFVAPLLGINTGLMPTFIIRFLASLLNHCGLA